MTGEMRACSAPPVHRLTLYPNRSLSGGGMVLTLLLIGVLTVPFAIVFLLKGAWLVLPFALLQLLVFGGIFAVLHRGRGDSDVVCVRGDCLEIIRRRRGHESRARFSAYWVSMRLERRGHAPSRLWLGSHGRWIEVGEQVGEEQRLAFAARLREVVGCGVASPEPLIRTQDSKFVALEA
jgi:uncharacterized membrane protein